MAFEMSLQKILELAQKDKGAAINAAKKLVVAYDLHRPHLDDLSKQYAIGGSRYFVQETYEYQPKTWGNVSHEIEFSFDRTASLITFIERRFSSPKFIDDLIIAGQPNQNLTSVVLGRTPEGITSITMPTPPQFGDAAFIYVESGFRQPAVVTFLDSNLSISENKPIMLCYWKPPFPQKGRGKLDGRMLSEWLFVLIPREFERYIHSQGPKQRLS